MSDPQAQAAPDPNAPWSPDEGVEDLTPEQLLDIKQSLPLLQEVIEWFDEQIADFLNPNVIGGVRANSDPKEVKDSVLFAQKMSKGYSKKRDEFIKRFRKHVTEVAPNKE